MSECGRFVNRHRWNYLDRHHRICEKCGTCEFKSRPPFAEWKTTELSDLLRRKEGDEWLKGHRVNGRNKALDYLRSSAPKASEEEKT